MHDAALEDSVARALARGDVSGAAAATIRGYGPEILGYLVTLLRGADAGNEVFAEVCEELWQNLPLFRRESSLRTWAYRVAWCRAVDHMRAAARARRRQAPVELDELVAEIRTTTAAHLRTSIKDRMQELRAKLAPDEQTLLILRLNRGLSWRDIAAVLSDSAPPLDEATVRKRFARLKNKLRRMALAAGIIAP